MHQLRGKQIPRRVFLYIFGIFIASIGVVLSVNAGLGVSPVNSLPFVLSRITSLTMGTCLMIVMVACLSLEILIMRKDFKWYNLARLLFVPIFGLFVDLGYLLIGGLYIPTYFGRLFMLLLGIPLISAGISLHIAVQLIYLPPEGLADSITKKLPNSQFHRVRMVLDMGFVSLAAILSLVFLSGLQGVREGTLLAAIFVGKCIPYTSRLVRPLVRKLGGPWGAAESVK